MTVFYLTTRPLPGPSYTTSMDATRRTSAPATATTCPDASRRALAGLAADEPDAGSGHWSWASTTLDRVGAKTTLLSAYLA